MESGKFPEAVPYSVKIEIYDTFHRSFSVKMDNNMDLDTSTGAVASRQVVNLQNAESPDNRGSDNAMQMLAKTPVWVIAHCLDRTMSRKKKYQLLPCTFLEMAHAADNAFLIEGILNPNYSGEVNERNKHIPCGPNVNLMEGKDGAGKKRAGNITAKMDNKTSNNEAEKKRIVTVVLYIPSIELFFCPLVQKQMPRLDAFALAAGKFLQIHPYYKVFDPCMAASLRIVRDTGRPSTGGFLEEFTKVYRIQVSPKDGVMKTKEILTAYHWQDHDVQIVPDVYGKINPRFYTNPGQDHIEAKRYYLDLLEKSPSNKPGCRKYVKHSYYKNSRQCYPNAYVIDSSTINEDEQILLRVVVHKSDRNHVDEQATIRVQRVCNNPEWERCRTEGLNVASRLKEAPQKPPVRNDPLTRQECENVGLPYGFDGDMYAFGKHVYQYSAGRTDYGPYEGTFAYDPELRIMSELLSHVL